MGRVAQRENANKWGEVNSALIEENTGLSFAHYRSCCQKVENALSGKETFGKEHEIALDFAVRTTELFHARQLTTGG